MLDYLPNSVADSLANYGCDARQSTQFQFSCFKLLSRDLIILNGMQKVYVPIYNYSGVKVLWPSCIVLSFIGK